MSDGAPLAANDQIARMYAEDTVTGGMPRAVLYLTALPHRALPAQRHWAREFATGCLHVESCRAFLHGNDGDYHGVPYGSRARLLCIFFMLEVIRSGSRFIERGSSITHWLAQRGLSTGGKTYQAFREQEVRLANCRFTTVFRRDGFEGAAWCTLFSGGMQGEASGEARAYGRNLSDVMTLSDWFLEGLVEHPTRLSPERVARLANQSMGLDIYLWLAYRLPLLMQAERLPWSQLLRCFGASYGEMRHFRPRFLAKLQIVLALYPNANVTIDDAAVTIAPSPPP